MTVTRVCVVGAGPAGLCAARHSKAAGMACTVFEQSQDVGGTWQYTDCVGTDRHGIPVHTSMYRDLRINLPKEIVQYPDFPHKNKGRSYITSEEILKYINDYADKFGVRNLCKFNHHVKKIKRAETEWLVTVIDLAKGEEHTYSFDAVYICNGLNNKPHTIHIEGAEEFKGHSLHSHDYRQPEPFSGQRVLIIGGGPSALDLTFHISKFAHTVFLSHHSDRIKEVEIKFKENVVYKKDARRLQTSSVEFEDGTVEDIDTIVYCTGYKCNYKFLDESCGITQDDRLVYPLYKYFVNAEQSSMCILGNLCYSMQFPTFDIQVRFFTKTLMDKTILPEKEKMLQEIRECSQKKLVDGAPKKAYFITTADEDADYYNQLAKMADIEPLPRVLTKIHARAVDQLYTNFPLFRADNYKVIDDENFVVSAA